MSTLLSINNYYYRRGGAEVVFLEQNRLFEEIGWKIVPFAMRHEKNLPSEWADYFVDEIEFGEDYNFMQKALRAQKVAYSFEARRKISQLLDATNPHVAHAHNIYHHLSPSFLGVLKKRGIPTVMTVHDLKLACPAYKMLAHDGICERCKDGAIWNVARQRCIKDSFTLSSVVLAETVLHRLLGSYANGIDRFVVPSRFCLEKLVEWGWPRERFTYIPNFVDLEQLRPCHAPGKSYVFMGRLTAEKGVATFVRAVAAAGVRGWIVGTGPEEQKLRALAESNGANIQFLGYQQGTKLFRILSAARALVLPSELYENAPVSIMEAYALERPVIGADIGGIPELIRENETGAMFPSGDHLALADKLRQFDAMSQTQIHTMGKAGRVWMENEFTARHYLARLLALYQDMGVAV
ncbi:glycosyltransferase family 4 protein [Noviherbaspirillum sedimenti]|uniref:glycosyltransferase family 4 protein n=1 Tax=Noviherbaspirillum sedimenti TaxID=2320865 RepID=UPI0018F6D7EF|nr:glycosyltransferase family 4 protein [Noviherbaspirillum sedimenti]